ncbi:MAG: YdhR family protein [Terracidiphilus sp.]|jgi:hypothetical protein
MKKTSFSCLWLWPRLALVSLSLAAIGMLPTRGQQIVAEADAAGPVVTVVRVPALGAIRGQIEAGMKKSVPTYQQAPGLIRKYFTISDDGQSFGGIYLWESRKAAESWFTESSVWHDGVSKRNGQSAEITYFRVPMQVDNQLLHGTTVVAATGDTTGDTLASSPVATVVLLPAVAGRNRAEIEAAMRKAVPTYDNLSGLVRKYFIISDDLGYGGIYLWQNKKVAEAWFNDSAVWSAGVSKSVGTRADITFFSVPLIVNNTEQK